MTTQDAAKPRWWSTEPGQRAIRATGAAVPVTLVNAVAFIGQYGYLNDHLPWLMPGKVMAALALESIAIYLAAHAHLAQLANDSALRLRLASYSLALVIGAMNYSHYMAPGWHPTVPAVMLGLMSSISPWLWAVHSRRVSRDKLMERGLVEEHAVRLGATRWMWHVIRAARVMYRATWVGESNPVHAINAMADRYGTVAPPRQGGALQVVREPVVHRAIPAPDAVPLPAPVPVPAAAAPAMPAVPARGEPAVHAASASLEASASLPHQVSQETIDAAELALAGMPVDELPSERAIARELLGDPGQRRLAKKLRDARIAAETQKLQAPASEMRRRQARPGDPQQIAWPQRFNPGGAAVSG